MKHDENPNSPFSGTLRETTYLVYIDDSGNETNDSLTALAIPVDIWAKHLKEWKSFRSRLAQKESHSVPVDVELHGVGLGTPSNNNSEPIVQAVPSPERRNKYSKQAFQILTKSSEIRIMTVYKAVPEGSGDLYSDLIEFVEEFCEWHDSHAIVWYDGLGQGIEKRFKTVHRSLPYSRRVLEDPRGYDSKESHLIQMADLVAYAAHQAILNDSTGRKREGTYLRSEAYKDLLPGAHKWQPNSLVWPGGKNADGFPCFDHPLGIRGYPTH